MKFTVAVGILAQTLPVISEAAPSSHGLTHDEDQYDEDVRRFLSRVLNQAKSPRGGGQTLHHPRAARGRLLKNTNRANIKNCDPTSNDPDSGILSCGQGYQCEPAMDSDLGGKCSPRLLPRKKGRAGGTIKTDTTGGECDPTSSTADVGILACAETHDCVVDPASSLGGRCTSTSRQLDRLVGDAGMCIRTNPNYQYYDCDCSGFDNVTGTGFVPCVAFSGFCLGKTYSGCDNVCLTRSMEYNFTDFTVPGYSFCVESNTPYTQKVCFEEKFDDSTCTLTLDDVPCTLCEIVPYQDYTYIAFDCTNANGRHGTTVDGLTELLPVLQQCNVEYCDLCGAGEYIAGDNYELALDIPVAGYEGATCGYLEYRAYENVTFNLGTCSSVGQAAQAGGCCAAYVRETYNCTICGEHVLYEDKTVEVLGYTVGCADFQPVLNGTECEVASPLVSETCCAPTLDLPAPSQAPTIGQPSSPTSDASTTMWSTSCLVSVMGLAAVTAGGLVLN